MTAFTPKGRKTRQAKVYDRARKRWVMRSTGTRDPRTANRMQAMLRELGQRGTRELELLDAVVAHRLTVPELWDAFVAGTLDRVKVILSDVDIEPLVAEWVKVLTSRGLKADTVAHYEYQVRTLLAEGEPFARSELTPKRLTKWLADRPGQTGTRRKYHAAMRSFVGHLVATNVLEHSPMARIVAPRPAKPRDRHLDTPDAIRLADAQREPFRTLSALLAGTGVDVSTALSLTRRDVDETHRELRARGTKSHARDRVVRVAEWAWPYLERHIRGLLPDARLFHTDRWIALDHHRAACAALGITDYWMRDARHTWAVRQARAGTPPKQIADQLGHANAVMVLKVYGVYMPTQAERDRWELRATEQDKERAKAREEGR